MRVSRVLTAATVIMIGAFAVWTLWMNVSDADVWWHIRAGQLMLETGGLIRVDPFAYAREGLPYLATHEWLAQIVLAAAYQVGNVHGILMLRMMLMILTVGILLLIDRKNLWPNAFVIGALLATARQHFLERPQLFSNACFALVLLFCLKLLDLHDEEMRRRRFLLIGIFLTTVLWANVHGAASLLAPLLLGTVLMQKAVTAWREGQLRDPVHTKELMMLAGGCALCAGALLITPNFMHNVTYLLLLFFDRTAELIREWNPAAWPQYLLWIGPFWVAAIAALLAGRRKPVAIVLMLIGTGILSRMAARHEILFLLTAVGCIFYALRWSERWQGMIAACRERYLAGISVTILAALLLLLINAPYRTFLLRRNLAGPGAFSAAMGAADFLDREKIGGRMFNTYTAGGYLLFRGRKVFLDGRNVDYGFDYLDEALRARYDHALFADLARTYGFTIAIIEQDADDEGDAFAFLEDDPVWALVFVDDWASVYLLRSAEHNAVIAANGYRLLNTKMVDEGTLPDTLSQEDVTLLSSELERAADADSRGIRALLLLAKLRRAVGRFDDAQALATKASERWPWRFEPYDILATIAVVQERWQDAAEAYDRSLELSEGLNVTPPYGQIATVFERAGEPVKAAAARRMAEKTHR